jgi:DNA mismatch endonuclease (patch repair protein)
MRRIKSSNTQPEMVVRRLVHANGYRYRLHAAKLPGKPDLVFASRKKAIFVHGCFWHQHERCASGHVPRSNGSYWAPKLERNVRRDQNNVAMLADAGWQVLVVWECEIEAWTEAQLLARIRAFLGKPGSAHGLRRNKIPGK